MTFAIDDPLLRRARKICGKRALGGYALGPESWWKIGGRVRVAAMPACVEEIAALVALAREMGVQPLVIGEMSNLLITDRPIDALCIRIGSDFAQIEVEDEIVTAQAGAWVPGVARFLQQRGLAGLEHICGIPGTLGGLVMMNGGSLRKSIGSHVVDVTSVTPAGEIVARTAEECGFAYRDSVFASNDEIIAQVRLRPGRGDIDAIRREMHGILRARRLKFPRKLPNCGSVFKSDPAAYAEFGPPGAMIEKMGWKGTVRGDAQVSPLHANFIVNTGAARTQDVLSLIGEIRQSVAEGLGHTMTPEVRVVRADGRIQFADEAYAAWQAGEEI